METPSENKPKTRDEEIEFFAELFFTKKEIMTIVDGSDDPIMRGRLRAEAELRESVFALAKSGSGPAQQLANQYIIDMKMKELDEKADD
jgi:hypothetical protein